MIKEFIFRFSFLGSFVYAVNFYIMQDLSPKSEYSLGLFRFFYKYPLKLHWYMTSQWGYWDISAIISSFLAIVIAYLIINIILKSIFWTLEPLIINKRRINNETNL